MKHGSHNLRIHYMFAMRLTSTETPILLNNPLSRDTAALLVNSSYPEGKLVPQKILWSDIKFREEWLVPVPKPFPSLNISTSDCTENSDSAFIHFPRNQLLQRNWSSSTLSQSSASKRGGLTGLIKPNSMSP